MTPLIETLAAPFFATVDFVLAAPGAAIATVAVGLVVATLVAVL